MSPNVAPLLSSRTAGPGIARCSAVLGATDAEMQPPASVRLQTAIVRALADHIEHVSRSEDVGGLDEQLVEELTRLETLPPPAP